MNVLNTPRDDPHFVQPMRDELTRLGFVELRTPDAVDAFLADPAPTLVFVNSVCGCAAGVARPAMGLALRRVAAPPRLGTVFAGQDAEATARARGHFTGQPPSSPSLFLIAGGRVVWALSRQEILGRDPRTVADAIVAGLGAA
jgi:putative YphP/YqiW family bacilliredoxin